MNLVSLLVLENEWKALRVNSVSGYDNDDDCYDVRQNALWTDMGSHAQNRMLDCRCTNDSERG